MRVRIDRVTSMEEGLVEQWRALAARALEPNPFFEPELARAAARHLPSGSEDVLISVEDGGRLVLALPLRATRTYRRLPVPAVRGWGHAQSFLGTPLLASEDPAVALRLALERLMGLRGARWLVLESAAADGPVAAALADALRGQRLGAAVLDRYDRPIVERRPAATYLDGRLSGSSRKRLRRQRRQLAELLGEELRTVDLVADAEPDATRAAVALFLDLEARGWKGRSRTALASTTGEAAMLRDAMQTWSTAGRAQVWALSAGGTVVASACAVVAGGTVFHLKIAYDERFARYSPGMLLELDLLEAFHADERLTRLDSCTSGGESPSRRLYPDLRPLHTAIVPLGGRHGFGARTAPLVPRASDAHRRLREVAGRVRAAGGRRDA